MNVIYSGNTLGDLSRNMLLGQELEDARAAARADENLRGRALQNQLAMSNNETGLGYANLGSRNRMFDDDLNFRRFQHGNVSAADVARNQLLADEMAMRKAEAERRWSTVSPDMKAQLDYQRQAAKDAAMWNFTNSLIAPNGGYPAGRVGDDLRVMDYQSNTDSQAAADTLNALARSRLQPELASSLDSGGWFDLGMSKTDAGASANALLGSGAVSEGLAKQGQQWFSGAPSQKVVNELIQTNPELAGKATLEYNPTTGAPRFVPRRFGPVPATDPVSTALRNRVRASSVNSLYPPSAVETEAALNEARAAIASGKDKAAVVQRLIDLGITPNL